ncbi:DEAD/DEAH box helicase family protein [uncultured Rhodoblastus sp.]|uniref:DEAD/DEAH box helicase n=1 Tax=uncultured Rhodoblastus sp. TaxID=543037 RepID=UPI0025F61F55|nr:DEAD/DEAH box helicase family protein [uncultured Rhodoblastus sp.]
MLDATSDQRLRSQIKARLSLRSPQADSLDILANLLSALEFEKGADPVAALEAVSKLYPSVEDFEREFPSLCFALATGVGKTRLMGAFITYLFLSGRSRNFFVLAPNTTIYEKLVADFTAGTEKYVFKGIAEFAQNAPYLVTGENWSQGRDLFGEASSVRINVFNVDKINKEQGRIKRLHEYIGESYFDYLAGLPDLVLLMDEAHRYRAKAGMKAVAELKPVMGLELTATPKTVGAKSTAFRNVVFDYGLGNAMADGFVKEPAVATRKDFRPDSVTTEQLERIKLEDGVHCHENVKAELDIYARSTGRPKVHPFMLVVAQTIEHAGEIRQIVEADAFFNGRYKGRVIEVHSGTKGEETDEATERLLALEQDGTTEIVIHVNKLKEGWDVRNLYTIVPLRASASDILTEQTLGRGLRLPYGFRTGVDAVDTLTVIAHDRFDEVIRAARDPNSIVAIRKAVLVGEGGDISPQGAVVLESKANYETALTGGGFEEGSASAGPFVFSTAEERSTAEITIRVIRDHYERELKSGLRQLNEPEVRARIVEDVKAVLQPVQKELDVTPSLDVAKVVAKVAQQVAEFTIEIPEIIVLPKREVTFGFRDFDLEGLASIAKQPVDDEIMIHHLRDETRVFLARAIEGVREERLENYLVRHLVDFPQIDYDAQSDLLFKLAGQILGRLKTYLSDDDAIENVLLVHGKDLARFIFEQMKAHMWETPTDYEARVARGFQLLKPQAFNVAGAESVRNFRMPVAPLGDTRKFVFGGFNKCCYPYQRFQSEQEREFAVLIDSVSESAVVRWIKPGVRQFRIEYASGHEYEPDFVVETTAGKLIIEIKRSDEMADPIVLAKARAAEKWVSYANAHAKDTGATLWTYVMIPHNEVSPSATLAGLVARNARTTAGELAGRN